MGQEGDTPDISAHRKGFKVEARQAPEDNSGGVIGHILNDLRASVESIGWPLAALLVFSLLAIVAACQSRPGYAVDVGGLDDSTFVQGFHAREQGDGHSFRWTGAESVLLLPEVGYPAELSLSLSAWRPGGAAPRVVLSLDGQRLGEIRPGPGFETYRFDLRSLRPHRGPAVLEIQSETFQPEGDQRELGVALESAALQARPAKGLLVIPPPLHVVLLLAAVALLYLMGERLGLGRRLPMLSSLVAASAAALVVLSPISIAEGYETLFLAALLAFVFTMLARAGAYGTSALAFAGILILGAGANCPAVLFYAVAPYLVLLALAQPGVIDGRRGLLLAVALSTFAIIPLFGPGVLVNSDQPIHLFWVSELDKLVEEGVFYSRWAPDQAFGWGGPIFNFYAPLSWYLIEGFHIAGMGLVAAMKAALAVAVLAGIVGMYLFARELVGRIGAMAAAVCFGYFPYFVADIHLRGEIGEPLAIGLIPSIFWAFHKLVVDKRLVYLPVAGILLGLLLLTHNVTSLFVAPCLVAYLVFMIVSGLKRGAGGRGRQASSQVLLAGSGMALGLGLSAFFWAPAVLEKKYIWGGQSPFGEVNPWAFKGFYLPFDWLYSLQLGSLYDGDGRYLAFGTHLLLGVLGLLVTVIVYRKGWLRTPYLFFAVALPVLVLLETRAAAGFWSSLPLVAFIQFPSRLLALTAVCTAVLIGGAVGLSAKLVDAWPSRPFLASRSGYLPALAVVSFVILTSMLPLKPLFDEREIDYNSRAENLARASDVRTKGQFLPVWVDPGALEPKGDDLSIHVSGGQRLTVISTGPQRFDDAGWRVAMTKAGAVTFDVNYFPGWQAYVDDRPVTTYAGKQNGRAAADLPAGEHDLQLRFESTPVQRSSEAVSLLAGILLAGLTAFFVYKSGRSRVKGQ